jgi:hypothetical protein
MGSASTIAQFFRDYMVFNPIFWGILAVILWIAAPAFYRALRGKEKEQDD